MDTSVGFRDFSPEFVVDQLYGSYEAVVLKEGKSKGLISASTFEYFKPQKLDELVRTAFSRASDFSVIEGSGGVKVKYEGVAFNTPAFLLIPYAWNHDTDRVSVKCVGSVETEFVPVRRLIRYVLILGGSSPQIAFLDLQQVVKPDGTCRKHAAFSGAERRFYYHTLGERTVWDSLVYEIQRRFRIETGHILEGHSKVSHFIGNIEGKYLK